MSHIMHGTRPKHLCVCHHCVAAHALTHPPTHIACREAQAREAQRQQQLRQQQEVWPLTPLPALEPATLIQSAAVMFVRIPCRRARSLPTYARLIQAARQQMRAPVAPHAPVVAPVVAPPAMMSLTVTIPPGIGPGGVCSDKLGSLLIANVVARSRAHALSRVHS